jgi:predicted cupin superfamily sugar epimerase
MRAMDTLTSAAAIVRRLDLAPHPEGGWYREVHRSREILVTPRGPRAALTSIYFLLESTQVSRWHVVDSDELWHHQAGAPLELVTYRPDTRHLERRVLGPPGDACEPIGAVPAGVWQAARSLGDYSLMGCDVGPGFDFADFCFISSMPAHAAHFEGVLAPWAGLL